MKKPLVCLLSLLVLSGCMRAGGGAIERDVEPSYDDSFVSRDTGGPAQVPNQASSGLATEAPLERADLRIERSGWIRVDSGDEMQASKKLRRMAGQQTETATAILADKRHHIVELFILGRAL